MLIFDFAAVVELLLQESLQPVGGVKRLIWVHSLHVQLHQDGVSLAVLVLQVKKIIIEIEFSPVLLISLR